MRYQTHGTCSTAIDIEMDGDVIRSVSFTGGCNGNLKGISSLKGIRCGFKPTSCPDQLAQALESIVAGQ